MNSNTHPHLPAWAQQYTVAANKIAIPRSIFKDTLFLVGSLSVAAYGLSVVAQDWGINWLQAIIGLACALVFLSIAIKYFIRLLLHRLPVLLVDKEKVHFTEYSSDSKNVPWAVVSHVFEYGLWPNMMVGIAIDKDRAEVIAPNLIQSSNAKIRRAVMFSYGMSYSARDVALNHKQLLQLLTAYARVYSPIFRERE